MSGEESDVFYEKLKRHSILKAQEVPVFIKSVEIMKDDKK